MAEDKVKLPRSSYEELCKIIKAYGRLTQPASLDAVSKLCAMGKTVISANNAFLANIGIIGGGKAKSATSKGEDLAKALEHDIPTQIQQNWARVIHENEFLNKMAVAVKIRKTMESSALEAHIAYSAGEAKAGPVMTGARAVVDILRAAGVVREVNGQLVADEPIGPVMPQAPDVRDQPTAIKPLVSKEIVYPGGAPSATGISLAIQLRIDAKPGELKGLGIKIKALLREIQAKCEDGENETTPES